jgi:3-oxoacyl-(acyl-carrier-protein) synthase
LTRADLAANQIHIVNTHATATPLGDIQECEAIRAVFGESCPETHINNTKSYIGHCMGAAGALELGGQPAFLRRPRRAPDHQRRRPRPAVRAARARAEPAAQGRERSTRSSTTPSACWG